MSAPVIDRPREAAAGPQVTAALDGMEVTQAVQEIGGSIPLVAGKRTFVRAYLGVPTGTLSVRGELRVARKANGPWTTVSSFGTADLDASRSGATSAQLRGRRENLAYSLDFRLPDKFTRPGSLWFKLGKVQNAGTGQTVQVTGAAARTVTFVRSPRLRLRVINLRYTAQTPPVQFAASNNDLEHLESWLTRAYPVREVEFSSITVNSTNAWPFDSGRRRTPRSRPSGRWTSRAAAIPAPTTTGSSRDGGGFMRGSASAIPGTPDPSAVASGPTGSFSFPWDTDGSLRGLVRRPRTGAHLRPVPPRVLQRKLRGRPELPVRQRPAVQRRRRLHRMDVGDSRARHPAGRTARDDLARRHDLLRLPVAELLHLRRPPGPAGRGGGAVPRPGRRR